jgi:hypothetical protein
MDTTHTTHTTQDVIEREKRDFYRQQHTDAHTTQHKTS